MDRKDISLIQTCGACPEQYDAIHNGEKVGYLRLRHGSFTVECPDSGGELVFNAHPRGDGIFETQERDGYLDRAKDAIVHFITGDHPEPAARCQHQPAVECECQCHPCSHC